MTRIAIVGTGPSGLYLGKYLNNLIKDSKIDFFEKSHRLFGLFRYGIAPDKSSIRSSCYSLASSKYRFFTGIEVGTQLKLEKLLEFYKYIFLCCGAENSKLLRIKNEQLGVLNGLDLIKYYNYQSEQRYISELPSDLRVYQLNCSDSSDQGLLGSRVNFDNSKVEEYLSYLTQLNQIEIGIIGNGNVALDIVRAFTASWDLQNANRSKAVSVEEENTGIGQKFSSGEKEEILVSSISQKKADQGLDINPKFVQLLKRLDIRRITVFGRSSLRDSKFTNGELRELLGIKSNLYRVSSGVADQLNSGFVGGSDSTSGKSRQLKRKLELFQSLVASQSSSARTLEVDFRFNSRVVEVVNDTSGNVSHVEFVSGTSTNKDDTKIGNEPSERRRCNLLVKCIGYEPSDLSKELLNQVDNRRIFANGWLTSAGRGDLNHTISRSLELARYVSSFCSATNTTDRSGNICNSRVFGAESCENRDIIGYLESRFALKVK